MKRDLEKIIKFQQERDWKQFHTPKNLAISLVLEASEVLEIFQWSFNNDIPLEKKENLAEELADVYYYLLLLAHESSVDLKKAFSDKMKINERKYPIQKFKGSSRKYNETND